MATTSESNSHSSYFEGTEGGTQDFLQQILEAEVDVWKHMPNSESCAFAKEFIEAFPSNDGVPEVGMVFECEESAYEFYNAYARKVGFSVRKNKVDRLRDGTIRRRLFTCANEGHRFKDPRTLHVRKEHPETRTGCRARMWVKLVANGTWVISGIIFEHNHPFANPSSVYMLRSQRKAQPTQCDTIDTLDDMVMRPTKGVEYASGVENSDTSIVGWKSFSNTKQMRSLKQGYAQIMLDYFKRMKLENPSFFYAIQADQDDHPTVFFWADSRAVTNYFYFGDVVLFDTTYRTNKKYLPFAPLFGVNHHQQIILFGAALLLDETATSFIWLFETWLKAVARRQPKTILTDQCVAIEKAIAVVLPETHHRLCLWHISQQATKYLPAAHWIDPNFQKEFKKCIYTNETEEDLQWAWDRMLKKYNLFGNRWLEGLYEVREKWALAYGRGTFSANLTKIQPSESINRLFKNDLNRNLPLSKFLISYEETLVNQRGKELQEDFNPKQTKPILCVDVPMLQQAAKEYTPKVFEMFQEEYKKWLCYNVENYGQDGTVCTYKVAQFGQQRECFVTFDSSDGTVSCSCKNFEFVGILCRHVMKVLNHRNIFAIPPQYILKRWTKNAKTMLVRDEGGFAIQADCQALVASRYSELCHKAMVIVSKSALTEVAHSELIHSLDKLLEEVEAALKPVGAEKPETATSPRRRRRKNSVKTGKRGQVSVGDYNKLRLDLSSSMGIVPPSSSQASRVAGDIPYGISSASQAASADCLAPSRVHRPFNIPGVVICQPAFPARLVSSGDLQAPVDHSRKHA